jgi:hypothetical protein
MCSFNPIIPVLFVPIVVALPPARMLPAAPCQQKSIREIHGDDFL